jgi:DNA uptake protein ComE-like DNA-binding protein
MKDVKRYVVGSRYSIGIGSVLSLAAALWVVMGITSMAGEARPTGVEALPAAAGQPPSGGLATADWNVLAPDVKGKEVLVKRCYVCHNLAAVVSSRGDRDIWAGLITSMIGQGADIPADDMEPLTVYLSTQFGPDKPRLVVPVDVNSASLDVLRLLPPIAAQADAIVKARDAGRFSSPEDLLKIEGITPEQFKKVRPFLSTP